METEMAMSIIPFPHIYIYTTLLDQTSKGTVHGQVRDCTSASPICRLLWHSSSSLTPLFPPPFSFTKTPPLLRFCSSLFFAAPTSFFFHPLSPPCRGSMREELVHTGPPFPRAETSGLSPFLHVRISRKLFTFSSSFPSLPLLRERVTYSEYGNNSVWPKISQVGFRGRGMDGWDKSLRDPEVELFWGERRFCERGQTWSGVWFRNGGNRVNAMRCGKWRKLEGGFWVNYRAEAWSGRLECF